MITVGIPTYNRAYSLAETIDAVAGVSPPNDDWELIVVDNNSSDETKEVCLRHLPPNGRYVFEPKPGVSNARNRVFQEARGELIVFTDDDTLPDENWLAAYEQAVEKYPDASFFMGPIDWEWRTRVPWWFIEDSDHPIIFCDKHDKRSEDTPISDDFLVAGPNMAVRREAYLRLGGFRPELGIVGHIKIGGEEPDLIRRYRAQGLRGYYVAQAQVKHKVYANLITFRVLAKNTFAAGFSNSLLADLHETGPRLVGMPRWWVWYLAQGPWLHCAHVIYHALRGQFTPVVYHLLRVVYWAGKVRYLFQRHEFRRRLEHHDPKLNVNRP